MDCMVNFIKEQIAMGGLSGIELNELWKYIQKSPFYDKLFYKTLNDFEKSIIIYNLSKLDDIYFYYYDKEGYMNSIKNNSENIVGLSRQIKTELPGYVDLKDKQMHGYCPFFDFLIPISKTNFSLLSMNGTFVKNLIDSYKPYTIVIVGSQTLRDSEIMKGVLVDYTKWSKTFYIVMELLTRAQYDGLFQKDFLQYKFNPKTFYFAITSLVSNGVIMKYNTHKKSIYFKLEAWIVLKRFYKDDENQFLKRLTNNMTILDGNLLLCDLCLHILNYIQNKNDSTVTIDALVNYYCESECPPFENNKYPLTIDSIKKVLVILYDLMLIEFNYNNNIMSPDDVLKMFHLPKCKKNLQFDMCPLWMKQRYNNNNYSSTNNKHQTKTYDYWNVGIIDRNELLSGCNKQLKYALVNNTSLLSVNDFILENQNSNKYVENFKKSTPRIFREIPLTSCHMAYICASRNYGFSMVDAINEMGLSLPICKTLARFIVLNKNILQMPKQINKTHVMYYIRKELYNNGKDLEKNNNQSMEKSQNYDSINNSHSYMVTAAINNQFNTSSGYIDGQKLESNLNFERKNRIVKYLTGDNVCLSAFEITKQLREDEKNDGLTLVICSKTVKRLLHMLTEEQRIVTHVTRIYLKAKIHHIYYYSLPHITSNNETVKKCMYDSLIQVLNPSINELHTLSKNTLNNFQIDTLKSILCKAYVVDGNKVLERITELCNVDNSISICNDSHSPYLIPCPYITVDIMNNWFEHTRNILTAHYQVITQYENIINRTSSPFPRYLSLRIMYYYLCVFLFGRPSDSEKSQIINFVKVNCEPESHQIIMTLDLYDRPEIPFHHAHPWTFLIQPNNHQLDHTFKSQYLEIDMKQFINEMPFVVICFVVGVFNQSEYLDYLQNTDLYLIPYKNLPLNLQKLLVDKLSIYPRVYFKFQILFLMKLVGVKKTERKLYFKNYKFYFNNIVQLKDTVLMSSSMVSNIQSLSNDFIYHHINSLIDGIKLWDDIKNIALNTCITVPKGSLSEKLCEKFNLFEYTRENGTNYDDVIIFKSDNNGAAGFDSRLSVQRRRSWNSNSVVYNSSANKKIIAHSNKKHFHNINSNNNNNNNNLLNDNIDDDDDDDSTDIRKLKSGIFIETNLPFTPIEDTMIYISSMAIEIIGNKDFIKYYWKLAKNYYLSDPKISDYIYQRSLNTLQNRSQLIKATMKSEDFKDKVKFFRNQKNIDDILHEIKIFKNIDGNFLSILSYVKTFLNNITITIGDTLPSGIKLLNIFHHLPIKDNINKHKFLNFEVIHENGSLNEIYKCLHTDHNINPFNILSEICFLNLLIRHAIHKFSYNDIHSFIDNIGHRKILNAVKKLYTTGIFTKQSKQNLFKILKKQYNCDKFSSIFNIPINPSFLKCIKSYKTKLEMLRNEKSNNELLKIYSSTIIPMDITSYNEYNNKTSYWLLCQSHLCSYDLRVILSHMFNALIIINLLPPNILINNYFQNYDCNNSLKFKYGFSINSFHDVSIKNIPLSLMNDNNNTSHQNEHTNSNGDCNKFIFGHLSTNFKQIESCYQPKKLFYHINIQPLPYNNNLISYTNNNHDSTPNISLDYFYLDYSQSPNYSLDGYFPYLLDLIKDIFLNSFHIDDILAYKISKYIITLLLSKQSSGCPYNYILNETMHNFLSILPQLKISHVDSLIRLFIACGLIIEIPLDDKYLIHVNFANEWHITVTDDEKHVNSFISRPWIDHRNGFNCKIMSNYMYHLFKGIIYDNQGITKKQIIDKYGKFLHHSIIDEMIILLDCDCIISPKRYPLKTTTVNLFGPPIEIFSDDYEDCYFSSTNTELSFIFPQKL